MPRSYLILILMQIVKNVLYYIDFFSVHANVCVQKSLKRTFPGFDPVMPQ